MSLRAEVRPPLRGWKLTIEQALADPFFVELVMVHWSQGKNTTDISELTFEHEYVIDACLSVGLEERRARK